MHMTACQRQIQQQQAAQCSIDIAFDSADPGHCTAVQCTEHSWYGCRIRNFFHACSRRCILSSSSIMSISCDFRYRTAHQIILLSAMSAKYVLVQYRLKTLYLDTKSAPLAYNLLPGCGNFPQRMMTSSSVRAQRSVVSAQAESCTYFLRVHPYSRR